MILLFKSSDCEAEVLLFVTGENNNHLLPTLDDNNDKLIRLQQQKIPEHPKMKQNVLGTTQLDKQARPTESRIKNVLFTIKLYII